MAALWKRADTVPLLPRKSGQSPPDLEQQLIYHLDDDIYSSGANLKNGVRNRRSAERRKLRFFRQLLTGRETSPMDIAQFFDSDAGMTTYWVNHCGAPSRLSVFCNT
jgi:hypothetical protein